MRRSIVHIDSARSNLDPCDVRSLVLAIAVLVVGCQTGDPSLSSTEQLAVIVSPASTTFPTTQVGQQSAPMYFLVSPSGSGASYNTITNVYSSCGDVRVNASLPGSASKTCLNECVAGSGIICPAQIACQGGYEIEQYEFSATFNPSVAAPVSCTITVVGSSNSVTINVNGTGSPPPLSGYATPGAINFGDVRVATASGAAGFTIVNNGGELLSVSSLSAPPAYQLSGPTSFSLSPGQAQGINVTCTPGATGQQGGALTIGSNFGFPPIALGCNGILGALDVSPSPAPIPTTRIGEPRTQNITLRNSGTASMVVASVVLTGAPPDMTLTAMPAPGTTLNPGATAVATVAFAATTGEDATGTLMVTYDGGQQRATQISAKALATSMSISPSGTIDLGPVCVGQSATKTFSVLGNAEGGFAVNTVVSADASFVVTAPSLPASLKGNAGNTYGFSVQAAPVVEGPQTTQVTVTTDIPGAMPTTLDLAVTGLPAGVSATPTELNLGAVPAETNTVGQKVTLTNCDATDAIVASPRIEGTDATEFSIVVYPESLSIPTSGHIEWVVIASPRTPGEKSAEFVVDFNDEQLRIPLTADGIGDQPGGTDGGMRPSYYACSTGGSVGGLAPLALALGFLVRRRRR